MAGDRFQDRFEEATYAADLVVEVFEQSPDERDAMCLSERLFHRLTGVARAYELPAMSLLQYPDMMRVNRGTCEAIVQELAFVAERLDDDLAAATAQRLTEYVAPRLRRPGWTGHITFDGD